MLIVQNQHAPGGIQNALFDLMRDGLESVRICSAYISTAGSELLFDGIGGRRAAPRNVIASAGPGSRGLICPLPLAALPACRASGLLCGLECRIHEFAKFGLNIFYRVGD